MTSTIFLYLRYVTEPPFRPYPHLSVRTPHPQPNILTTYDMLLQGCHIAMMIHLTSQPSNRKRKRVFDNPHPPRSALGAAAATFYSKVLLLLTLVLGVPEKERKSVHHITITITPHHIFLPSGKEKKKKKRKTEKTSIRANTHVTHARMHVRN